MRLDVIREAENAREKWHLGLETSQGGGSAQIVGIQQKVSQVIQPQLQAVGIGFAWRTDAFST